MLGQMMYAPLLISSLIDHAGRYHARSEVISVGTDGAVEACTWASVAANGRRVAAALTGLGLAP